MTNKLKHFYKRLSLLIVAICCLTIPFSFSSVAFANSESNPTPKINEIIQKQSSGPQDTKINFDNICEGTITFATHNILWKWGQGVDYVTATYKIDEVAKYHSTIKFTIEFIWSGGETTTLIESLKSGNSSRELYCNEGTGDAGWTWACDHVRISYEAKLFDNANNCLSYVSNYDNDIIIYFE